MDKMITTQTFTMARWQIVVKKSEATKQRPKQQQKQTKTKTKKPNVHTDMQTKHPNILIFLI